VFTPQSIRSSTLVVALSLALLTSAMSGPAAARPLDHLRTEAPTSSLAGTTDPRQDLRSPDATDAARRAESAALAIERSYSSYSTPRSDRTIDATPKPAPEPVAVTDRNGIDWTAIGAVLAGGLLTITAVVAFTVRRPRRRVTA
jgi:hypothetical protein